MTNDKSGPAPRQQDDAHPRTQRLQSRSPSLETQLRRFAPDVRRRVRKLVRRSQRTADLAHAFPGLLHAIADDRICAKRRAAALDLVEDGARLNAVAQCLRVPYWLRRLPPEAFQETAPDLVTSPAFSKQIAVRLPMRRSETKAWFDAVAYAVCAAHEPFAIWIADRPELHPNDTVTRTALRLLAAYAWHSTHATPGCRASKLIVTPWQPGMTTARALHAVLNWLRRIELVMSLPDRPPSPWLSPATVAGLRFHHLQTADGLLEEARLMRNCIDHYGRAIRHQHCQIYSIRTADNTRIATLEIGPHPKDLTAYTILQLRGPANMQAPTDVWSAAYRWLSDQGPDLTVKEPVRRLALKPVVEATSIWSTMFASYLNARPLAQTGFTAHANLGIVGQIHSDIAAVARESGVTNWRYS